MTTLPGPVVLDTNVILHLTRGNDHGQRIDTAYNLGARLDRPLISIVTWGECLAFARNHGWGHSRLVALRGVVSRFVVVNINAEVVERYATIHDFLWKIGRRTGDNDVWIAATAAATSATLITTDADFDPLAGQIIQVSRFALTPPPS